MTTDITELTQKRNAAISRLSRAFEPGHSSQSELDALSYTVDVMNELVEALEKAQRANAAQDDHINQMAKRIRRLEIKNTGIGQHINSLNRQIAGKTEIEQQQAVRIAELESRTVKLPNQIEFDDPLSAYEAIEKCKEALTVAGIKCEAE